MFSTHSKGNSVSNSGGINREHGRSVAPKLVFAALHAGIVIICIWLAFGDWGWPDQARTQILAFCAVLYGLRHLVTLFVLLKREVGLSEVLGLSAFIALFEIGFILLGAGLISGEPTPFGWLDWVGLGMVLFGSFLNTGSEVQRWMWKKKPSSKGRCYTKGLFRFSMHINYFGDSVLFTGWAILASSIFAWPIPIFITASFVFFHIPPLDDYLAKRYGDEFKAYDDKTAKLVPFLY